MVRFELWENYDGENMLRLKDLREDKDLRQKDVAQYLNIAERTYSGYETENRWIPKEILISLAIFYDTSVDYILGLTNEIKPYPRDDLCK